MGKFIDEVAKINQNDNHRLKISEERQNVRNELYKRFCREFRKSESIEDAYNYLMNWNAKQQICYYEYDFGNHVTMEYIDTTYYKELKKVYKMFQEHEKIEKEQTEKQEISSLYIIFDEKGYINTEKTFKNHINNNKPYDIEKVDNKIIKHYKILDRNNKPYDLKIYFIKCDNDDVIDYINTVYYLRKDGLLDGIKFKSPSPLNPLSLLVAIPIIILLLYLGFYALIGIVAFLFIFLIILCS